MTIHFELVLIFLLTMYNNPYRVFSSHCVMYGFCGDNDFGVATCYYNGTAIALNNKKVLEIFEEICPDVLHESDLLCCSAEQVAQLQKTFVIASTLGFGRCPSCIVNFRKNFCHLLCSPRQSDFLKVTGLGKSDEDDVIIEKISYYMSVNYAGGMFASCKDVQGLTPGSTALALMCGLWGQDSTAERLLQFIGSTPDNEGFSPYEINYYLTSESRMIINGETFIPMNESTTSCSESPYPGENVCTCSDCESACQLDFTSPSPSTEDGGNRTLSLNNNGISVGVPYNFLFYISICVVRFIFLHNAIIM